jgi:enamine deaminase RidA (YjgF/YER057c/UK114 family)
MASAGAQYGRYNARLVWASENSTVDIDRRHQGKRFSQMVIHHASRTVYLAGQTADDPKSDVSEQTRQVLARIDRLLAEAGTHKGNLLSATVFLPDIADFAAMNAVWEPWLAPGAFPVRATVQAALASPEWRVEIQAIAAL